MSVRDRIKRMEQMAMQEKEAAPDERGRSPGGVSMASSASASGSPRPLSKVRTSFVAIADKDGRLGLRHPSGESSSTSDGRKLSGDTDAAASTSSSLLLDHNERPNNVFSTSPDAIRTERGRAGPSSFSGAVVQDAGPGNAAAEPRPAASAQLRGPTAPAGPICGSAGTNSKPTSAQHSGPTAPAGPGSGPAKSGSLAAASGSGKEAQKGLAASPQITEGSRSEEAASRRAGERTGLASGSGPTEHQGQALEESPGQRDRDQGQASTTGRQSAPDAVDRTDNKATGANGSAAGQATPALNGADKAKTTKSAPASSTRKKTAGKPQDAKRTTTPAAEKKSAEKKTAPSNVSPPFVKPRPRSPTQPVKLPERLTTHTTASATRTKNGAPPSTHVNRPASRTSMASSGKGLGRSGSVNGRQHASFGPPPKQSGDHPVKESKPVDESFLARMMRPTQAYANKVADKVQLPPNTPPHTTTTRKPASSARTGPVKKVAKSTTNSAAASPETNKSEPSSAAKHIAKKLEAEKPIAEEALPVAKKAEKTTPGINGVSAEEKELKQEATIKEPVKMVDRKPELPTASENKQEAPKSVVNRDEICKPSEKVDASKTTLKVETPKPSDEKKDGLFKPSQKANSLSEGDAERENISKSTETSSGSSTPSTSDQKDEKMRSKTFDSILGRSTADEKENGLSKPAGNSLGLAVAADKQDSGLISSEDSGTAAASLETAPGGQKSADDKLVSFMKGGLESHISNTNGNHSFVSGLSGESKAEVETTRPFDQSATLEPVGGSQPRDEQEEW